MARRDRVKWREPYGVSVRRAFDSLRAAGIFNTSCWIRPFIIGPLVAGAMIGLFVWAFPGTPLPWMQLLLVPLVLLAYLAVPLALVCLLPQWIEIRPDRVVASVLDSKEVHPVRRQNRDRRQLESIELMQDEHEAWWLFVRSRSKTGRASERLFGVAANADIDKIKAMTARLAAAIEAADPPESDADPATTHLGTRSGDFVNRNRL